MKILHVSPLYLPSIGGAEIHIQKLSEKLAQMGNEVTVFTSQATSHIYFYQRQKANLKEEEIINGVKIKRFPISYGLRRRMEGLLQVRGGYRALSTLFEGRLEILLEGGPIFSPSIVWKIARAKADIVCAISLWHTPPYLCYLARKISKFRFVIIPLLHTQLPGVNRQVNFKIMKTADAIAVSTKFEKEFLLEHGISNQKIKVAGVGVDVSDFKDCSGSLFRERYGLKDNPVVTFLGKKHWTKGIDTLIQSMKTVWGVVPSARLVLAGTRVEGADGIERRVNMLDEKGKVIWIDNFPEKEKPDLLAGSDVFVLPSCTESFGIVYLEAWMCQKPVIGCSGGPVEDVINQGEDGLLVEYGNTPQLAEAILTLLQNRQMRERFGRYGREKVLNNYTWDIIAQKIERIYRSLL